MRMHGQGLIQFDFFRINNSAGGKIRNNRFAALSSGNDERRAVAGPISRDPGVANRDVRPLRGQVRA